MRRSSNDTNLRLPIPSRILRLLLAALLLLSALLVQAVGASPALAADTYDNPLLPTVPGDGLVESCADPSTIYAHDGFWYTYCTTDPLNDEDRNAGGGFNFRRIPTLRSSDLVTWTYVGDAFTDLPAWASPGAGLWAPEIDRIGGIYYLFYGITEIGRASCRERG